MALKTTSTPLDRLELAEWRATIATWVGVTYANEPTVVQTEIDRLINEAHEYISKRFGHEPWATRETTLSVTSGTATYSMPADMRHVLVITEEGTTLTTRALLSTKTDYLNAWGAGHETHPWAVGGAATRPIWFFDGMTSDEPPVQQWKRVPSPTSSFTARVHYRPFFTIIEAAGAGANSHTVLPATHVGELRAHIMHKWAIYTKNYDDAQILRQVREDEIAASQINDTVEHEDPMRIGLDAAFWDQLG